MAVQIHNTSKVPPLQNHSHNSTVPLSFHDCLWFSIPPVQRLFLYPPSILPFHSLLSSLKSSLSYTLSSFHVLAGKMTFNPSSHSVFIDCSASAIGEGITFLEAGSDDLDFDSLARDDVHDLDAFHKLIPTIFFAELPMAVFAVQVTRFSDGGVALGIAFHHAVIDGKGLWQFMHAWARNCKSGCAPVQSSVPVHDRSVIRFDGDQEMAKALLKDIVPNLPKILPDQPEEVVWHNRNSLARRTFTMDKTSIQTLKQIPLSQDSTRVNPASTFITLIAHTWISLTRARVDIYGSKYTTSHLIVLIDERAHLNPPVDQSYTGNCLGVGYVHLSCFDLLGPTGFARACSKIEQVIETCRRDPLSGCTEWHNEYKKIPHEMTVNVAASPRFRVYDTDFGWGKPSRVELVSMNIDGEVAMVAGREEGTVQISACVSARFMDEFAKYFVNGVER